VRFGDPIESLITDTIHLPGLRGSPERTYPITAVERAFPGLFSTYTASIVAQWQQHQNYSMLDAGDRHMRHLGLADGVRARRVNDTEVDLHVARLPGGRSARSEDTVSIADVGIGVSQTLPVVVSLLVAKPGQTVYIEQPEIHLHPRAQFRLADVLVEAANRGVRVVVETHSSITLLGIQAAVAERMIRGHDVALHWFSRDRLGQTRVQSVEMGESGELGDWPEDFSDVYLQAQGRYLDAVEKRQLAD